MLSKQTLSFLNELDKNNDREWFNANKGRFVDANDNVIALTGEMIGMISRFDPEIAGIDPKTRVFRIYRDVRFSPDKRPYKTNLGAFISPGNKKELAPGYYFHIQPGMCFAAAGKHQPNAQELLNIRNAIAANFPEFKKIVNAKAFRDRFGDLDGEKLSRPPKGFPADHPAIEYLKLKSFTVSEEFPNKVVLSADYPKRLSESFKAALPLVLFLRRALAA